MYIHLLISEDAEVEPFKYVFEMFRKRDQNYTTVRPCRPVDPLTGHMICVCLHIYIYIYMSCIIQHAYIYIYISNAYIYICTYI